MVFELEKPKRKDCNNNISKGIRPNKKTNEK